MDIPLVNLKAQYKSIKKEVDKAIATVIESTHFVLGEEVKEFENEFSKYCQTKYTVGLDSGLSALELGMRALGIGPGDEVITPANSFIASSGAISFCGATPVLVDCNEDNFNIDPSKIEKTITKKTKAVMVVHLYGQPVDLNPIIEITRKHKLFLIEDACQAHGAKYRGRRVGSFGDFAAFSFYPGKNLGAYGDGGAIVTNNKELAEKVSSMRNYGQREKYNHVYLSWNKRLDTIQAAVLLVKLKYLDKWNKQRLTVAQEYIRDLQGLPIILPRITKEAEHVFHLFVIRTKERDKLADYLKKFGITTGIHYPIPIHLQPAYKDLGYKVGDFPVTEKLSKEILSLPIYPELSTREIVFICNKIKSFFS